MMMINNYNIFLLREYLRTLLLENDFAIEDQTFSDSKGVWHVSDIIDYAVENGKMMSFSVKSLAEIAFLPSAEEEFDELPGSPEFIDRAMKADLKYPIIVIRYDDGDFIADGNHRLWKARAEGRERISGYLLQPEDLVKIKPIIE